MAVYIVQHGKSLPKEADPERGLSEDGIKDVKRIADVAKAYKIGVSEINHSGKKRAEQTARIFAEVLSPSKGFRKIEGIGPMDDVKPFSRQLNSKNNMMIVGHLPFLEKLVSFLITGETDIPVFKLQNGGILCIDQDSATEKWFIKWGLMPDIN